MKAASDKRRSLTLSVITLGLPILVSELGHIATGFADNMMVGRYATDALASASMVNNLFNIPYLACIGFAFGITPLVGMRFAQSNYKAVGSLLRNGIMVNLLFGLAVSAVMLVIYFCLDRLGQPDELLPIIRPYFIINILGIIPIALFNVFAQWSYGIKQTRIPMWITLISNIINVAGNYVLIFGAFGAPEMGLTGAGISTLSARVFCPVAGCLIVARHSSYRKFFSAIKASKAENRTARKLAATSLPVSLQMTLESASFSISAIFIGWIGTVALASYQIATIVSLLGFCLYYSMASSGAIIVANAAGRGDNAGMRRAAFAAYRVVIALAVIMSAVFLFAGPILIEAFTDDTAVIEYSLSLIPPLILYQLGDATQVTFANCLRGTANVMPMLWTAMVCYVVVGIPAAYIFAFSMWWGGPGIVYSFSVSLFLAAALYLFFFLRTTRRNATGTMHCQ